MPLGDHISSALSLVGITEERVSRWLGNCRCLERHEKLNWLGHWSKQVLKGKVQEMKAWLERGMMET